MTEYRTYLFRDKDPIIDLMRTLVNDQKVTMEQLAIDSGVNPATLRNWFYGETRYPRHATVQAIVRALGYRLEITGGKTTVKSLRMVK